VNRASVLMVRLALVHLAAGCTLGALMLAGKGIASLAWIAGWRPLHQEMLLIGWLLQLVFGVAYGILPRLPGQPRDSHPWRALACAVLLNAGVAASAAGLQLGMAMLAVAGRSAELVAALLFATIAWKRVRPYGLAALTPRAPAGPA
jgi:hypothetical protein